MTLGIRQKLIIALAATSLLITTAAFLAMLLSFRAGFLQYINDHRYQSLQQLQNVLHDQIVSLDQWEGLSRRRKVWDDLIFLMRQNEENPVSFVGVPPPHTRPVKPPRYDGHRPPSGHHHPPPRRKHRGSAPPQPFVLLDANKQAIYGRLTDSEATWFLPLTVQRQLVGYVAMDKLEKFQTDADQVFVTEQTRYFIGIAVVASMIALGVAFLLARWMVSPIQRLDKAMSQLMKRDYDIQVNYQSRDEVGRLVSSFNKLSQSLGEYDQSQQQWIADISHELRTPIATLRGEVEAMIDGVRDTSPQRLTSLHEEIIRLQRIVDDLHQLSLSDSGAMRYAFDIVSIVKTVEQVIERNHVLLHQSPLYHDITVIGNESAVYGDADRLSQLFYNLLQNSLRYTDAGGQLHITLFFKNNKTVNILWEDSEPGVSSEALPKLFDRLYREDQSRNRERGGSGLGLSVVKAIVEAHGGHIIARASKLGGVVVDIELPLVQ